jgi:hypothetical protein
MRHPGTAQDHAGLGTYPSGRPGGRQPAGGEQAADAGQQGDGFRRPGGTFGTEGGDDDDDRQAQP